MTEQKYGIIGCGMISGFHFDGLEKIDAKVIHVSDVKESSAAPYVERTGARFSEDWRELVANREVTTVFVLANTNVHLDMCLEALKSGKNVVCEKTLASNLEEALKIARAVKDSGRMFFTAYMKRFFPAFDKLREILPSLGTIFSSQARTYQFWGNLFDTQDPTPWQRYPKLCGGAVLKCCGSHIIDMVLALLGRPESVYAHIDYIPASEVDRKTMALMEYESGMVVNLEVIGHPLKKIGYEHNSWDEFIQINGVDGRLELFTVTWNKPEKTTVLLRHYDNRTEKEIEYYFDPINPYHLEVAHFDECLRRDEQTAPSVIDGLNVDIAIDAMEQSSRQKKSIPIDWQGF